MIVIDGRRVEHDLGPRRVGEGDVAFAASMCGSPGRDGNRHTCPHIEDEERRRYDSMQHEDVEKIVLTEVVG